MPALCLIYVSRVCFKLLKFILVFLGDKEPGVNGFAAF